MAAKKRSTDAARARLAASVSLRLAPVLDNLVTMTKANLERDYDVRLALAERAAQLANALLVATHDTNRANVIAALETARVGKL